MKIPEWQEAVTASLAGYVSFRVELGDIPNNYLEFDATPEAAKKFIDGVNAWREDYTRGEIVHLGNPYSVDLFHCNRIARIRAKKLGTLTSISIGIYSREQAEGEVARIKRHALTPDEIHFRDTFELL